MYWYSNLMFKGSPMRYCSLYGEASRLGKRMSLFLASVKLRLVVQLKFAVLKLTVRNVNSQPVFSTVASRLACKV
ncbi:hypothetical protein D3C80_1451480 [compost metagenome]